MAIPLIAIFEIGAKLIDKLIPDPQAKAKAQLELAQMQQNGDLAQLAAETDLMKGQQAINVEEAKSDKLFIAGWRPFIGWTCGVAFAYHFIVAPLLVFFLSAFGHTMAIPSFDMSALNTVLMGMLGLGGLRTYEKIKK